MPDANRDNNPFRQLDKQAFPDTRNTGEKPLPGTKKQVETAPTESDDALFLHAMEAVHPADASVSMPAESLANWADDVRPLTDRRPARKARTSIPPPPAAAPAAPRPEQTSRPQAQSPEFAAAMCGVRPLTGKGRTIPPAPECKSAPPATSDSLQDFLESAFAFALQHTNEYVEGHVIGLDPVTIRKLQAGRFSPEGSLDLHGLNALQAYQRLIGFMRNAYLRSWRTVLIVPGRGLNSPNGLPVLREKVQTWLTQEPLRRVVLAFCTAQPAAGGAGAMYVLLRKMRKDQGKVQWDRNPVDPDLIL